ncbi:MOS1T transposase, partial [Pseudoatta argentina]
MLQKCYGDDTLSKTQVYQWYERFKSGREAVEDDARPGRPSTSKTDENVDEIRQLLIENRKLTIREIAETTNISFGSVQSILREDLGLILHDDNDPSHNAMCRVIVKFVPQVLTEDQKNFRIEIAEDILKSINKNHKLHKRVITGDKTWVAKVLKKYLETLKWDVLPHPPHFPDIVPSYWLFQRMQHDLASHWFISFAEIENWLQNWIASKDESFFRDGIQKLPERWEKVVASNGQYFN